MTYCHDFTQMQLRQALRLLRDLPEDVQAEDDPAFTTEQVNLLEKRLFEVRSLLEGVADPSPVYADWALFVHDLLAEHRQIAAIWSVEDVKNVRPHLTDEQAWEVLERVGGNHDAECGISWTTLETVADDKFPMTRTDSAPPWEEE